MDHLINRQVLDIRLSSQAGAYDLQQVAAAQFRSRILPMLEKAFDAVCPADETICIDRLELDLGQMTPAALKAATWADDWYALLLRQLEELVNNPAKTGGRTIVQPQPISITRQWLYFLEKGYLPWNARNTTPAKWEAVISTLATDHECIRQLRFLIQHKTVARQRIVRLHDDEFFTRLLQVITARENVGVTAMVNALVETYQRQKDILAKGPRWSPRALKQLVQEALLTAASASPEAFDAVPVIAHLQRMLLANEKPMTGIAENSAAGRPAPRHPEEPADFREETGGLVYFERKLIQGEDTKTPVDPPAIRVDEEGIFARHSGLVLLHPFLNRFFGKLDMLQHGKFLNRTARSQSILLLHYLSAGNREVQEYDLVIPKILCGCPLEEPVDLSVGLSDEALQESDNLLSAVVLQWEALKNSSIAALREGFLQRQGKVFTRSGQLWIQVERGSIDVLLDRLPWPLSMIKLPWMHDVLRVEWR